MYKVNPRMPEPIYIQIMTNIKENVFLGLLKPGDKIPSIRDMAKTLTTNPNTVAKAYKELERENVIEVFTGRGTFVTKDVINELRNNMAEINKIRSKLNALLSKSKYYGITSEQIKKWIEEYEEGGFDNSK